MNLHLRYDDSEQFTEQYGSDQFTAMKEDMLNQFVKSEIFLPARAGGTASLRIRKT